jgi:hypothetical protein
MTLTRSKSSMDTFGPLPLSPQSTSRSDFAGATSAPVLSGKIRFSGSGGLFASSVRNFRK